MNNPKFYFERKVSKHTHTHVTPESTLDKKVPWPLFSHIKFSATAQEIGTNSYNIPPVSIFTAYIFSAT